MATKYEKYNSMTGEEINPFSSFSKFGLEVLAKKANQDTIELEERTRGRSRTPRSPPIRIGHHGGPYVPNSSLTAKDPEGKTDVQHGHRMVDVSLEDPSSSSGLPTANNWPLKALPPVVKKGNPGKLTTAELVRASYYRKQSLPSEPDAVAETIDNREPEPRSKALARKVWLKWTTVKYRVKQVDIEANRKFVAMRLPISFRATVLTLCILAVLGLVIVLIYFLGIRAQSSKKH